MFQIESSPLGRVVVAARDALFYTTIDFPGRLDDQVAASITSFIQARFGLAVSLTTCVQVHGVVARAAGREARWRECDSCDALWSAERGVALGIKVADCLPLSIAGDGVIANIHSGWRGAVQKITSATLDTLPFDPRTARAYLGPSIRACCFEVGEEVVDQFADAFPQFDAYVDRSRTRPHIDVARLTAGTLRRRGFADANIFDSGLCTRCEGSIFHSYRRDGGRGGRNLAIVAQ
ncbi:MAG TPA: polyphenol oxidase family protein [Thermoanaerobaculia bacterium]|nr:polyphenol oxidase family protein [Thermoanaerobaculia bacterium]